MSDLVLNAKPTDSTGWTDRARACIAVTLARLIATLPPARLVAVLNALARSAKAADVKTAVIARDAILSVSVRCSGRYCLDRSIAIALVCRMQGQWPQWYSGVATEPFRAHAWVSVNGIPVGEPESIQHTFIPTLRVLPER